MENISNKFLKEDKIFDRAFKIVEGSNNLDDEFINILDLCEEEEEMESSFKTIFEFLDIQKNNYKEKLPYYRVSEEELKDIVEYTKFIIMSEFIMNIEGYTNIFRMLVDKDIYEDNFNIKGNTLFELFKWKNIKDKEKANRKYKNEDYILEENRYKYLCRNIKKRFEFLDSKDNKNFSGKQIFINSIQELDAIEYIWEKNKSKNMSEEKIKRINSARKAYKHLGSLHIEKITDKDLNNLHEFFVDMIESSGYQFKNIYYYKLEKKMGYYLIKNTLKNINKIDDYDIKKRYSLLTMVYIWQIPMLKIREKLSNELFYKINNGDEKGIEDLSKKIREINIIFNDIYKRTVKVIQKSINAISLLYKYNNVNTNDLMFRISLNEGEREALEYTEDLDEIKIKDCTEDELEEFKNIFNFKNNESEFSNKFKIKKDYNKEDLNIFFEVINEINDNIDKVNKGIEL